MGPVEGKCKYEEDIPSGVNKCSVEFGRQIQRFLQVGSRPNQVSLQQRGLDRGMQKPRGKREDAQQSASGKLQASDHPLHVMCVGKMTEYRGQSYSIYQFLEWSMEAGFGTLNLLQPTKGLEVEKPVAMPGFLEALVNTVPLSMRTLVVSDFMSSLETGMPISFWAKLSYVS